ncbi:eukaryotic translation initiation factor 5A-1-like [Ostrea edulis]|uniref:eukaryotic translation initiation factor 5A-1-like n=1 Tax=Ostrea edulis TaxID=37623 RepID=UPI0024AE9EEA|nr:eukaryotic translation initiation factor 5A-1-like [Ostrea edulis]XP_048745042.2 eukaryotic translation initiation factor 5A-1-like [Ostrea edulis]
MGDNIDDDFTGAQSGAANTVPAQCSSLRKNGFVCIKGRPCKIVEMSTSKTGKHGHAKVHLVGIDIYTQKKYEDICPSTHNMNVPIVTRTDYQLIDIEADGTLTLLEETGNEKNDMNIPSNDLGKEIKERFENGESLLLTITSCMDMEQVTGIKVDTK